MTYDTFKDWESIYSVRFEDQKIFPQDNRENDACKKHFKHEHWKYSIAVHMNVFTLTFHIFCLF